MSSKNPLFQNEAKTVLWKWALFVLKTIINVSNALQLPQFWNRELRPPENGLLFRHSINDESSRQGVAFWES